MGGRGGGGQGGHKQIVTCYSLLIAKVRKVFKKNKTASLKQIQEEKKKSAFSRESGKPSLIQ